MSEYKPVRVYECVCGWGGVLLCVFMYIENKFPKFTETALPLPLTSDERDCYLLKVESRIFKNAFNCLHSLCNVRNKFNRCCENVVIY